MPEISGVLKYFSYFSQLSDDWKTDYDVYTWTKLDPDDEKTKKLVEQYFLWIGTDKEGRPFKEGKIFK